jgi:hypothetical protein
MKIYFSASISGGRADQALYARLIARLREVGTVLTEHIGDPTLTAMGEANRDDRAIHDRDLDWIRQADLVIAEVTTPSLGVGYEIAKATEWGKRVLCLHRSLEGRALSAMVAGCPQATVRVYGTVDEAMEIAREFVDPPKRA